MPSVTSISAVGAAVAALVVVAVVLAARLPGTDAEAPGAPVPSVEPQAPPPVPLQPDTTAPIKGVGCIRGGTSRDEVRLIMGEPDSIVFGDWLYGRSSVTFGYGVVLDYSNADGNLPVCP